MSLAICGSCATLCDLILMWDRRCGAVGGVVAVIFGVRGSCAALCGLIMITGEGCGVDI